jgi:acyl-CoA hydrolase
MSDCTSSSPVCASQSERSEIIFPADTNALGNLFGGRLMQFMDLVGAMAASRHARSFVVTASMDHLDFVAPVRVGDLLILKSSVNRAFRTSMEIGVKAMVEDVREQRLRHVSSAYLTFVAVDAAGNRIEVPQVIPKPNTRSAATKMPAAAARCAPARPCAKRNSAKDARPEWHL